MSRVLVTGVNGFVGRHLARELAEHNVDFIGTGREADISPELRDICANYEPADLSDPLQVARLSLDGIGAVINLAGLPNTGASVENPAEFMRVNVDVHTTLCDELLRAGSSARIVSISTGLVYSPDQPMPLSESSMIVEDEATNPYVISKKRMEHALRVYRKKGLNIIIARAFNHFGPGQGTGFLIPDLAEQIINTQDDTLLVGNLNTKRDYTPVERVVEAYRLLALAETLRFDTYNVCSGVSRSGLDILHFLKGAFGRLNLKIEVDPKRIRPNDVMDIYGDASRIRSELGWEPGSISEETFQDFVDWRLAA